MQFYKEEDSGRIRLLFNDFVVKPDKCNFKCKYCLSNEASILQDTVQEQKEEMEEALVYQDCSVLKSRLDKVMERFSSIFDSCILRISGGELFLIRNIEEFLKKRKEYETIQIITNGSLLTKERLESLKNIGKCQLHISLDGVTYEQNNYRVQNEKQHNHLIQNLERAVSYGFDIEVGSVLTNANTGTYREFLEYLKQFQGKVKAYPFPIRGEVRNSFYPTDTDKENYMSIIEDYEDFKDVLPPKGFIEETIQIFNGKRMLRCRIPSVMVQLFDNGDITPCPNSWTSIVGNVLENGNKEIMDKMEMEKMYKLFLQKRPRLECCLNCLTSLDVVNLFFEQKISLDEITSIPLYSGIKTKKLLSELADFFNVR